MKKSLEQQATEKAKLVNMNSSLQSSLKQKDVQLKEMSAKRSTIHEETGIVLSKLQLSETAVKTALERRGLNITDLYSRIITLEEDLEKMRRGKNEAEMQLIRRILINRHLEHVLKEIEEKTPILQQQQVEYQTMVSSQQRLTQMYTQVSK